MDGPAIDVVRIDARGGTVLAGKAPPNATVVIRLDGAEVAKTQAAGDGTYASLFDIDLLAEPQVLSIEAATGIGPILTGGEGIIVAPALPVASAVGDPPRGGSRALDPMTPGSSAPGHSSPAIGRLPGNHAADGTVGIVDRQRSTIVGLGRTFNTTETDVPALPTSPARPTGSTSSSVPDALPSSDPFAAPASPSTAGTVAASTGGKNAAMTGKAAAPRLEARTPAERTLPADETRARASITATAAPDALPSLAPGRPVQPASGAVPTPSPDPSSGDASVPTEIARAGAGGSTAPSPANPDARTPVAMSPETAPVPQAPKLFRTGPSGVTLIDGSGAPRPDVMQALTIEAIGYDAVGEVRLTGRAPANEALRVYLDGAPVLETGAGPDGVWSSKVQGIRTGLYTLRVDAIAPDGTVTSRVETPFQRTAPEIAAAARRDGATAITVQPGFTLWAISEGYFGTGIAYVQLFEANRDQIRDPDLIFPGQIFTLPEVASE